MTSPYASPNAVADALPTPAPEIETTSQLTAVAGVPVEDNLQMEHIHTHDHFIQMHANDAQDNTLYFPDNDNGEGSARSGMDNLTTVGQNGSTPTQVAMEGADATQISLLEEQGAPNEQNNSLPQLYYPEQSNNIGAMVAGVQSLEVADQNGYAAMHGVPQLGDDFYNYDINEDQVLDPESFQNMSAIRYLDPPLGFNDQPSEISSPVVAATRIQAFAKLEFDDGEFYMNTHSLYLGRDLQSARVAMRRDKELEKLRMEEEARKLKPETPIRIKKEESRYSKSLASEAGGILRDRDESDSEKLSKKKKSRKTSKMSKSSGSSPSRRNSFAQAGETVKYEAQPPPRFAGHDPAGAASVDLAALVPDPDECPLIGIHPPASATATAYKAISRRHVQIAYNKDKHLFEAVIMGRNGAFIDGAFFPYLDVGALKSGSILQIGAVMIKFVLPNVIAGETGAEQHADCEDEVLTQRYSEGGKEMSFDFDDGAREGAILVDTSEESSDNEDQDHGHDLEGEVPEDEGQEQDDEGEEDEEDEDDRNITNGYHSSGADGDDLDDPVETIEPHNDLSDSAQNRDKKRRPGRPPKDGVMSKREKKLAKRAALDQNKNEKSKKSLPPAAASSATPSAPGNGGKNKVGRPRKHPRPETPPVKKEKRKYTKRKPKEPKDPNAKEGSGDEQPAKEKKEKKPPKPPRSPSPEVKESDFTPEQLAKPPANYVTLIHEALSNSKSGPLSLPDIYRAIQRKWPYFKFRCSTNGWQSSVRHNLSQHHAFTKVGKEGKGYSWTVVEGISIEKEKKRRITPPPGQPHMHPQQIYQAGHPPHMYPYGPPGMIPPPGYQISYHPNGQQMHPHYMGHHPQGQPMFPPLGAPMPPPYPLPPQLAPQNQGSYSSPYAPKPQAPPPPMPQTNMQPPNGLQQPGLNAVAGTVAQPAQLTAPPAQLSAQPSSQSQTPASEKPPAPTQLQQSPTPTTVTPNTPVPNFQPEVRQFIETFKPTLLKLLTEWKSERPEAVVDSVANRILGLTNSIVVENDPHQNMLIDLLTKQLRKKYGDDFNKPIPVPAPAQQTDEPQSQSQSPANQNGTQGNATSQLNKSTGSEKSTPTVMRPSFTGRPNIPSIPRPPIRNPGMQPTSSESPSGALPPATPPVGAAASPAAAATSPATSPTPIIPNAVGASTPKIAEKDPLPQGANSTRWQSEEAEISKRLNGSGQLAGLKRPLEDLDMDDDRDFKRHAPSGPPQLKT